MMLWQYLSGTQKNKKGEEWSKVPQQEQDKDIKKKGKLHESVKKRGMCSNNTEESGS